MADYAPSGPSATDANLDALNCIRRELNNLSSEVAERNSKITSNDDYIYGDRLENSLDIPLGHDHTNVNWLRRTVEIHKTQFMGRPFQVISTYNTQDESMASDDRDKSRLKLMNAKQKALAELRAQAIKDIIRDNGGHSLFAEGAEAASVAGNWIIKTWYDQDNYKFVISPIEAVENCWALWDADDFRSFGLFAYVQQLNPQLAAERYNLPAAELQTSPLGSPFLSFGANTSANNSGSTSLTANRGAAITSVSNQPMVTVLEATGKIPGYKAVGNKLVDCKPGDETAVNATFVGQHLVKLITDPKKLPHYYILPNKRARRRPWGLSDISSAAIEINQTFIEALSDWRTVQNKINFPKFRGFNFGPDTQMPKFRNRKVDLLPLGDGQDIQLLQTGDTNGLDFEKMLETLKEQFVRETGISRVLFDDPSITLNSNQALLTSMKPTSDIAENKKQLWEPILVQLFDDAIRTLAAWEPDTYGDLASDDSPWFLRVQWPSIMQKEDPIYQQMLLNRKNAGTISVQSYLEAQGETKEEIDRIRDEMDDPVTAAILGNGLPILAANLINPPQPQNDKPTANISIKGETLDPALTHLLAMEALNSADRQTEETQEKAQQQPALSATPANNTPGAGAVSQPGSGAPPVSPQGALDQLSQQQGQ